MSMLMLTSLTYVETEQYLVVLFLVTAPRLIVRASRGHRYAHAFIWKNKELSVCNNDIMVMALPALPASVSKRQQDEKLTSH